MLSNFVLETVNAPGTSASVTLLGAVTGRKRFRDKFGSGTTCFYYMEDGTLFESGIGVLTHGGSDTFNRQTVLDNSSGTTSRLNFAGVTRIYNEVPAQRALWRDPSGNLDLEGRFISALWWGGSSTGSGSAYVVNLPKAVTSYVGGLEFKFRAHANSMAAATINAGMGAKPIHRAVSTGLIPIQANEIVTGQIVQLIYDITLDLFQIVGPAPAGIQIPIGSWLVGGWASLPPGCLWPDGRNVSRTTYAGLFTVYGTSFGSGDGSTTFGLPDLRGRTIIGKDNMGGSTASRVTSGGSGIVGTTLGAAGGSELMQTHNHGVTDPGHTHGVTDPSHFHTGITDAAGTHGHFVLSGGSGVQGGGGSIISWNNVTMGATSPSGPAYQTDVVANHQHNFTSFNSSSGVSVNSTTTGATVNNQGAGSSQNMPPGIVCNVAIYAGVP